MNEIPLSESQESFQQGLLEHPNAPRFNFQSSDMLTQQSLQAVREFERSSSVQPFWSAGRHPDWLADFTEDVSRTVPYHRAQGRLPKSFEAIPTMGRQALREAPWSLVPDHLPLQALTVYTTSGTSGAALAIPTDPAVSSMLLILLDRLLATQGRALPKGEGKVAIALVACRQETLTYASLSHVLNGAAFLKLNLAPHCWGDPDDRVAYLLDAAPGVITGCPYAFEVLAQIAPTLRPQALVSSAVALHPGQQKWLFQQFDCPVFDVYSMTEARMIAGRSDCEDDLMLLSSDLYLEILGPNDEPLAPGEVGQIVLTGGRNPYFPLLRYRTGDRAALVYKEGRPHLRHFEGRRSVNLHDQNGQVVPTLDVVHALKALPMVGFSLRQAADRSIHFRYAGLTAEGEVAKALAALFGTTLRVEKVDTWDGKAQRFNSELPQTPT